MADIQHRRRFDSTPMVESAGDGSLLTSSPTINEVLGDHASAFGHDFTAYRNYVYRVVNLCTAIMGNRGNLEKVSVAAAFHDLIESVFTTWPSAGFHWSLVELTLERLRTHPLTPLPMVKL